MIQLIRKILKWIFYAFLFPLSYFILALIFTLISVNKTTSTTDKNKEIYISTNGIHLDIIIPIDEIDDEIKYDLRITPNEKYLSFGWGDEDFYLNTPTWSDLTFTRGFKALFLKSSALLHVTRFKQLQNSWIKVRINDTELLKLNQYISTTFKKDLNGKKMMMTNHGYSINDDFYKANGNFSCFKTCNTWVNSAFKKSDLKACLWTPFDFGLIYKYQ